MVNKIVVFDLDETLGSFVELCIFWNAIIEYIKSKDLIYEPTQKDFNELIEKYPEFIRPNIYAILSYLKTKKNDGSCYKVMIYTNNKQPKSWVILLKNYFESIISNPGFVDQIICAFKINGKQIELCRTTHDKNYDDFIQCSKLQRSSQICFVDDIYYPNMHTENIFYIKIKPYIYKIPVNTLLKRFTRLSLANHINIKTDFNNYVHDFFNKTDWIYNKKKIPDFENDKTNSNNILERIKLFFNTQKSSHNQGFRINRFTLKNRTKILQRSTTCKLRKHTVDKSN